MLDDEIVFLGSSKPSNPLTGARATKRPVTGITLHVQKNGATDPQTLAFRRANTSIIEIGRRSGADADPDDDELESAMFRCAVVSRKHAKIAFTDAGNAFLIDRNSHHGTHIRKAGENTSKMIKPETYTLLDDGDLVTFGKAVGKGDDAVPPITVRVELQFAAEGEAIKPLKPSSGYYGLKDSSSSSDESSGNQFSDIEEISSPVQASSFGMSAAYALNSVLKLTQRLPPIWFGEDSASESSPVRLPPPRGYGESSKAVSKDEASLPSVASLHAGHFVSGDEWNLESRESSYSNRSRSNSPMELASPSPPPQEAAVSKPTSEFTAPLDVTPLRDLHPFMTMRPIHHWAPPPLPPTLPPFAHMGFPPGRSAPYINMDKPTDSHLPPPPWVMQPKNATILLPERPVDHSPEDEIKSLANEHEEEDEDSQSIASSRSSAHEEQMEDIDERLFNLETVTSKLQTHRRKYRKKFNSNVELLNKQLAGVDDRIEEVNAECTVLFERVERMYNADVPDLQGNMENVQDRIEELEERDKARAAELMIIVESVKQLKADTERKMAEDIAAIKAMIEAATIETPVLPSLKRKHDDIDENEDEEGLDEVGTGAADAMAVCVDPAVSSTRPTKRPKRIVAALAQSATALTIGAVVTWSALAFS